jgi:hypothetical protein
LLREIGYNSQRNNFNFAGKFPAWSQCFSTCAWMLLSYYCPASIIAKDDEGLQNYVDDVEATVGKPGIGEKVRNKFRWITGNTSLWWNVQKEGIEKYMWMHGCKGSMEFHEKDFSIDSLQGQLKDGPIILGTDKMGGLPDGHIILLVDYDDDRDLFIVNDPFGNARTNYSDHNGEAVKYSLYWLRKYSVYKKPDIVHCMFWVNK